MHYKVKSMRWHVAWFVVVLQAAEVRVEAPGLKLVEPFAVAFDSRGRGYICEYKGQRVVRFDGAVIAGAGQPGWGGDGGPATQALLRDPHGIVVRSSDELYIADTLNHCVRKVDLRRGVITRLAGTGTAGFSGDGGPAAQAQLNGAFAIALDAAQERLYIADLNNRRIRMVNLKTGVIRTVAGNGATGVPTDGAKATESPLVDPRAVASDRGGNLYILERRGNALRMVDGRGIIRTLIGPGAVQPELNGPKHLCVDRNGDIVIADTENHLIRSYSVSSGRLTTLAGTGKRGDRLDPKDVLQTELARPHGVYVHQNGDLYIADSENNRVLRIRR